MQISVVAEIFIASPLCGSFMHSTARVLYSNWNLTAQFNSCRKSRMFGITRFDIAMSIKQVRASLKLWRALKRSSLPLACSSWRRWVDMQFHLRSESSRFSQQLNSRDSFLVLKAKSSYSLSHVSAVLSLLFYPNDARMFSQFQKLSAIKLIFLLMIWKCFSDSFKLGELFEFSSRDSLEMRWTQNKSFWIFESLIPLFRFAFRLAAVIAGLNLPNGVALKLKCKLTDKVG